MARVRWECPVGEHAGVIGPSRPRKDDIVRYCLQCSLDSGRLVQRTSPSLERVRALRAQKRTNRDEAKTQRYIERLRDYYTVHGIDLRKELVKLCEGQPRQVALPNIRVRRCSVRPRKWGHYNPNRNEIMLCVVPGSDVHDILETFAHEVAHYLAGYDRLPSGKCLWHGTRWRNVFRNLVETHYGVRPILEHRFHGEVSRLLRAKQNQLAAETAAG